MPALSIRSKKAIDKATAKQCGFRLTQFCEGPCNEKAKNKGRRSSTQVVTIMGQQAAMLCDECAGLWKTWWGEAVDKPPS